MPKFRLAWIGLAAFVLVFGTLIALPTLFSDERDRLDAAERDRIGGTFVSLPAGVTHFERSGPRAAPTVVLVHGFDIPAWGWDTTFTELAAAGYDVIRYDLFGRGLSDRPRARYDRALFVQQLAGLLDSLRVHAPAVVVGHAMGGKIAAAFAAQHPARVAGVVLIAPVSIAASDLGPAGYPLIGDWLLRLQAASMPDAVGTDVLHPERLPDWPERFHEQTRYHGFARATSSMIRHYAVQDPTADLTALRALGIPTLLVWGAQDRVVPIERTARVVELTGAELVRVDSAGHRPHVERPALVNAALLRFLAAHTDHNEEH